MDVQSFDSVLKGIAGLCGTEFRVAGFWSQSVGNIGLRYQRFVGRMECIGSLDV